MRCTKTFAGIRLPARAVYIFMATVLMVVSIVLQVNTKTATAATSSTINFQARLMTATGAIVPDGYYNVEFKLYNAASSSGSSQGSCTGDANCLWTETRTGGNTVRVANGYLTANLGSVNAFPSTINWNEELWLSMNIGGTGVSPTWDGPMTPRLKITAVAYAFRAGQLAKTDSGFTSTLDFVQPTANRSILLPNESGTVCLQASSACGFLTGSPGDYIQNNQTGTPQSANIFIQNAGANSGDTATIKLGASQTGAGINVTNSSNTSIWKVTSTVVSQSVGLRLSVNSTTADTFVTPQGISVKSAINIPIYDPGAFGQLLAFGLPSTAQDTARAISVFDGRTSGVIQPAIAVFSPNENDVFGLSWNGLNTVASLETGSAAIALRPGGVNVKLWAGSTGVAIGNNVSSASYPLDVTGDVNTSTQYRINGTVICTSSGCTPAAGSANYIQNQSGTNQSADFRISGTGRANTAMMTPLLQPTADGTTAMKIQNTGATVTAMTVDTTNGRIAIGADTAAQEKLDVIGNLQVRDAATATKSYRLRTSGGALDLEGAGANLVLSLWSAAGYTGTQYNQITFKSDGSSMDFARGFNIADASARVGLAGNVNPQYSLDVNGDINTSTQYRIGGTIICTASGCTPASGSANYIQNQNSGDQTANFRISGTGRANTALQAPLFDTATAAALNIGTTNATAINLNKDTTVTGAFTQSGGSISMTGNAASQIITTSNNALNIRAGGTAILTLNTSGAGTVNLGTDNTTTINIGGGTDVARTIRVGDPQSAGTQAQTVSVGSQRSTSATTIQGGNGASAIAMSVATGGNITMNAQGSGSGFSALLGSDGFALKTTTDSSMAFAVQASNNDYIFSVNTSTGTVTLGATQVNYSGFDGSINTPLGDLTIGATNNDLVLQGSSAMTLKATSGSFTTTVGFTAPTANRTINFSNESGTICLQGSAACGFVTGTAANFIQNSTTVQSANFYVQAATSGSVAGILRANAAGTGNILNLQNGAGTNVATFSSTGAVVLQNTTNSTGAFRVSTSTGDSVLRVDTTNERVAIGVVADPINAKLSINTASVVGLRVFQGGSSDAFQAGNGTADFLTVSSTGNLLLKPTTNSTTALQVQNAAGTNVLRVDTVNQRVAIGNTAPALKFEVQDGDAAIYNNGNNARLVLGDNSTTGQYGWLQWDSANDYFRIETAGSNGLKIKDNNVSIGNIFPSKPLIVGTGTTPLFEIGTTGQVQTRTSTNTTTAFQIQNNLGDIYFNADSTNKRIGIGNNMVAPEVTLDVSGAIQQTGMETPNSGAADNNKWTKLGTCTLTTQFSQCLTKIEILGGYDGSTGNNTQATVTARVKQQNAMGAAPYINVTLNDTAEVITKSDIVAVTTVNTGANTTVELYGRITNTFESWAYTPVLNSGGFGESTWNWTPGSAFVAALPAGTQTPARFGNVNANLFLAEATNTNAAVIQNAGGTNKLFVADTQNLRIAINQATATYTLDVAGDINTSTQLRIAGVTMCDSTGCTAKTGSGFYIHNQATVQSANMWVQAATSGSVAAVLQANAAGTGAILQLKNGAGTNVGVISSTGAATFQNSTNSTAGFIIQAAAGGGGNAIFRVDTTNERIAIGVISDPIAAKLNIATSSTVSLRAFQGSTNEIFQLANSSGDVFNVASDGSVNVRTRADSANAFRIQNNAGTQVFNVDSVDNIVMVGTGFSGKHIAMDIETTPYIEIVDSTGTNGVSLAQTEGSSAYLTHDSDLIVQRSSASATDFRVLNPSDVNLFTVDSSNSRIVLGASDTTGALLVLDTKTDAADPTGVNGGMYYNSNLGKFRCYEGSAWKNCLNGDAESVHTVSGAAGTAMTKAAAGTIILTPIYIPGRMTVNELRVAVLTTALGAAGDVGIYNSAGTLVINGGSSSLTTGTGLKTITPTQAAGAARTLEPGQYYMAVTWNSTTGSINSVTQSGTFIKRNGTIATGGGLVLPSSVTLSGITAATGIPAMSIAN